MNKSYCLLLVVIFQLSACTSHQKKILLYANSDIQVDETQKNIIIQDGTTQIEKELTFSGSDPVVLKIQGPKGSYTLEATEDGLYLANLKKDTVVGSLLHIGNEAQTRITQDQLKFQLDSLNKLVSGITTAGKNYFVPPGKIVKISNQLHAKIFGPYSPVPSAFDVSSVPEIYKFYS